MLLIVTVGSMALTLGLALSRPQVRRLKVEPGVAAALGVLLVLAAGGIGIDDVVGALEVLWEPLVTIASIMLITAAASRLGVLRRLAAATLPRARGSTARLFLLVFLLSAGTAAVLNNDGAVLLLTPIVVLLIRELYPEPEAPVVPFAFAVFMAAGVAPLVVSNPMNMIVAGSAGIGFNAYAQWMAPISVAGWAVAFAMLWWVFRGQLGAAPPPAVPVPADDPGWRPHERRSLAVLLGVLAAYPVVSFFGGPIWIVALTGAAFQVWLCRRHLSESPVALIRRGVSWDILGFLLGVFLLSIGLRNAGVVDWLADVYRVSEAETIGVASAVGSAVINNHAMGLINLLSLDAAGILDRHHVLSALIGGDLGPRLLPTGSLAGLLWFASLRRIGVAIPLRQFFVTGAIVTIPSLAVSLFLLSVISG